MRTSRIGLCVFASGALAFGVFVPTAYAAPSSISVTVMKETNNGPVAGPLMPGDTADVVVSGCASGVTTGTATSKAFTANAALTPSADRPTLQGFPAVANVAAGTYTVTATCGGATAVTSVTVGGSVTPVGPVQTGGGGSVLGINRAETGAGVGLVALAGGALVLSRRKRAGI